MKEIIWTFYICYVQLGITWFIVVCNCLQPAGEDLMKEVIWTFYICYVQLGITWFIVVCNCLQPAGEDLMKEVIWTFYICYVQLGITWFIVVCNCLQRYACLSFSLLWHERFVELADVHDFGGMKLYPPKHDWIVQGVIRSCTGCLFSHATPGNLANFI